MPIPTGSNFLVHFVVPIFVLTVTLLVFRGRVQPIGLKASIFMCSKTKNGTSPASGDSKVDVLHVTLLSQHSYGERSDRSSKHMQSSFEQVPDTFHLLWYLGSRACLQTHPTFAVVQKERTPGSPWYPY